MWTYQISKGERVVYGCACHQGKRPLNAQVLTCNQPHNMSCRLNISYVFAPACSALQVWRARLPASLAVSAGVDLHESSAFFQDVGRFLFAYPISSGDYVWTVGVSGGPQIRVGCI